jgi:hypothetical protein
MPTPFDLLGVRASHTQTVDDYDFSLLWQLPNGKIIQRDASVGCHECALFRDYACFRENVGMHCFMASYPVSRGAYKIVHD